MTMITSLLASASSVVEKFSRLFRAAFHISRIRVIRVIRGLKSPVSPFAYFVTTIREAVSLVGASMWWRAWEANFAVKNSATALCYLRLLLLSFAVSAFLPLSANAASLAVNPFLLQVPLPTSGEIEHWLIPAAALLWLMGQWKKVFPPRRSDDSFDARFLALTEKIDRLGTTIGDRLSKLEATVARLDERTKTNR